MAAELFGNLLLADWATDAVSGLAPDQRFALIVIIIGCATGVICSIVTAASRTINSIHRRRVDAEMKREMIERGMSADEIVKIMETSAPLEDGMRRWIGSWAKRSKSA